MRGINMIIWTCPNTRCEYNKQLYPDQTCPTCGKEAKAFEFDEFGSLLKAKAVFKKSAERAEKRKKLLSRLKFCPKCGSPNINFLIFYQPSIWKCFDCNYQGTFVVEDSELAEKIQADFLKTHKEEHK
ncbi:MAG: hypothetical protein JSV05_05050 [Candidatus Bathyarchaeota archaeon]|nr:MAG: hypothetical protein JSV05_05050 [Candidatus Bathyarchaeota archaeon]